MVLAMTRDERGKREAMTEVDEMDEGEDGEGGRGAMTMIRHSSSWQRGKSMECHCCRCDTEDK